MSAIDILILILTAVAALLGYTRGLLSQVGSIAGVVVGVLAARLLGGPLTSMIGDGQGGLDTIAGYGIMFVVGYAGAWIAVRMLKATVKTIHLGLIDRIAGAAFALFTSWLMLSLALNFYLAASGNADELRHEDKPWRKVAVDFAPAVLGYLSRLNNPDGPASVIFQKTITDNERE